MMTLRPFNINDAETILSWCKDKHAFRLWSADRYKEFPAQPDDMMEQYTGNRMFPLTAIVGDAIVGHILLRFPSEDKSVIRFGFVIVDSQKRGNGYGREMLNLAIRYGFEILKAEKITLGVFENNKAAYHCYRAAGFREVSQAEPEIFHILNEDWKCLELEIMQGEE